MAIRAVEQLRRVELTYSRVIQQTRKVTGFKSVEVDEVFAEIFAGLPRDHRDRIQDRLAPVPPVYTDRAQFVAAVRSMLAYLLRIGDPEALIKIRLRIFGDAVGVSMGALVAGWSDAGRGTSVAYGRSDAADAALARWALDEPALDRFASSHYGLFRRCRDGDGETLWLILRTKGAACMTV